MSDNTESVTPREATPSGQEDKKVMLKRPFNFKQLIKFVVEKELRSSELYGSPLLQLVFEKEKKVTKQVSKKIDVLDYLLDSSNFEIDLFEPFDEQRIYSLETDPSAEEFYRQLCEDAKLPPVGYICEHLKERNFVMRQHYLPDTKMLLFIEALKLNTTIESLDLSDNHISAGSIVSLCEMLKKNTKVFTLNLSHNNIRMKGVSSLAILLDATPNLISLFLARNSLGNKDITPLTNSLKSNFFLTTLDLSYNKISSEGGYYLGNCLAMNETLHVLDLHWCQINGKGATELAKGLRQNPSLKVLDIGWNGFAEESCWSLALSLMVNTSLKILDLTKNRIIPRAAILLSRGIENNQGLEILILDNNLLGDDGAKSILNAMSKHPRLQLLSLQGVRFSEKIYNQVVMMQNKLTSTVLLNDALDIHSHLERLCQIYLSWLEKFVLEHKSSLQSIFEKYDTDQIYHLGKERMRFCLEKKGFYLPLRHMAVLLGKLGKNEKNLIAYRPLFDGGISKIIKAEELKRKYNIAATRSYLMGTKTAWN